MIKIKNFLLAIFLFVSSFTFGQSQCQDDIDKANEYYEDGLYNEAEQLAKKVLETCTLDKTQENEMLKLMASIYYELDELELADEYVDDFMKKNPYYIPSKKNDPYQFRLAIKRMKTWPRFTAGLRIGEPLGFVTTKKIYPILDTADYTQNYTLKPTLLASMEFAWNITSYLAINIGAGIRIQKLSHQVPQYDQLFFNYEEKMINLNAPVLLQFTIPLNSNFSPMIYLGGEVNYFAAGNYSYYYSANSNISNELSFYLNRKRDNVTIEPEQRNLYRYGALGGIRLLYKHEKFSYFADFRYIKEFTMYNNPDKKYANLDLYFANNYTLSDIEFETIDISVGILYNFSYKVKSKY